MRLIEVRQPRTHDVIGRTFTIAGFGTGFEATVLWRLLGEDGGVLGEGKVEGVGSNGVLNDFGSDVSLPASVTARGAHVLLQVFGDDASGENPPGPDLNEVAVTLFSGLQGWKLHEVRPGDTLAAMARDGGRARGPMTSSRPTGTRSRTRIASSPGRFCAFLCSDRGWTSAPTRPPARCQPFRRPVPRRSVGS